MPRIGKTHVLRTVRAVALALAGLALGACTVRDYYVGKSLLQPDQVPKVVERDENGNPILP